MYATSTHIHNVHNHNHYHTLHHSIPHQPHPIPQPNPLPSNPPPPPPPPPPQRNTAPPPPKEPIVVLGIPSVSIEGNHLVVGSSQTSSTRSYTPLKVLGDGSFGTVWLCDWHGTLPPNTPLSPMQCGQGARPEWAGKRLVAVKRMKKRWEGGWDECQQLKELESLRAIPFHENIIPLYDFFLLPASKELYFVFESMEGNLYHLIKARKGRALAGGLVSSIFRQIVSGLDHIHSNGYFHRDMKPENVLVTTTGLFDYTSVSPTAPPNAPKEKDVVAIIKLADFGLARETKSKPPYTEYVSTRWYRAPEVLLLSRDYSNPVDMWALGTIMAELVNLRPLFPGSDQVDQVGRICEILGDPTDENGFDSQGSYLGGGPWPKGLKLAKAVGFQFQKTQPKDIYSLFERTVPVSLIHCIRDLLRYDPDKRLTSRECLEHAYLQETTHRNNIPIPSGLRASTSTSSIPMMSTHLNATSSHPSLSSHTPRNLPASHSHSAHHVPPAHSLEPTSALRSPPPPNVPLPQAAQNQSLNWSDQPDYPMDISPPQEQYVNGNGVTVNNSSIAYNGQAHVDTDHNPASIQAPLASQPNKLVKLVPFSKKHSKWSLGLFGGDKHNALPPVDEIPPVPSFPSRKRTQSSSTDSKSLREPSPVRDPHQDIRDTKKNNKKEAERLNREAEKERHRLKEKMHREQARAVMQKRQQMIRKADGDDIEWLGGNEQRVDFMENKPKQASSGPIRQKSSGNMATTATVNAAAGKFAGQAEPSLLVSNHNRDRDWRTGTERVPKARRREFDDDHSMSSSEVHSLSRMSSISFATVDSDPGPSRIRHRPSLFGLSRMTSRSSLRTSFDDFPPSARSSNSFSLEGQLVHDFRTQASMNSHISGSVSPPPLQMLSLSPTLSPSLSPSPPWIQVQQHKDSLILPGDQSPPYISIPQHQMSTIGPHSPLDLHGYLHGQPPSPYSHPSSPYGHPPSSGNAPRSAKSAINPMFKVVSYKWDSEDGLVPDDSGDFVQPPLPHTTGARLSSPNALPPFSQLEAVAGGNYSSLSPMLFPEDT